MALAVYLRRTARAGTTPYFTSASSTENVLRKPTWAFSAPIASMEAPKDVPTSILNDRPVILPRQSAMALPALVIFPESPEGTKVMTIGLSGEPRSPAFTLGALASGSQAGGGTVAVGAAVVAAVVGAATVGAAVGTTTAAGAQAPASMAMSARPTNIPDGRRGLR